MAAPKSLRVDRTSPGDSPWSEVTDDGSPVAVYLALPAGDAPALVHAAIGSGASLLELGCGAGRMTRMLSALGHHVVAVDTSAAMARHVTSAEVIIADVMDLVLYRSFDGVLAASHLINAPTTDERRALLRTCRRHVKDDGVVLLERYEPGWMGQHQRRQATVGPVEITFRTLDWRGDQFDGEVTYQLGSRTWTQSFTAAVIDDTTLADEALACGLQIEGWLDEHRTWALLRPAGINDQLSC